MHIGTQLPPHLREHLRGAFRHRNDASYLKAATKVMKFINADQQQQRRLLEQRENS
jgi:hypothetical protein